MIGKRLLLAIALVLLSSPPLLADEPDVDIFLKQGAPRLLWVNLHATALCWGTEGCPEKLTFRWLGTPGKPGEKIQVEYRPGLFWQGYNPGIIPAANCLQFPGDTNPFEIEHGPTKGVDVILRHDNADCKEKDKIFFFYDIRCIGGAKGNCDGVKPLDPGTMIDNGN